MEDAIPQIVRLIFVGSADDVSTDYTRGSLDFAFPGSAPRPSYCIEARSAREVLDHWNGLPAWEEFDPHEFRKRIISFCGADDPKNVEEPIELPATDDEILDAVVAAAGPGALRLEIVSSSPGGIPHLGL
jgi:hypothetical protein